MNEDIKLLLSYIETEIREGKKQVIGNGVIVNGEAILSLIKRIRVALSEATGEDKVNEATQKANEIIALAEQRKESLIDNDIATKEARVKAERIIQQAMIYKSKMENTVAKNLAEMLNTVKETITNTETRLKKTSDEALKSLDSAIARVNSKLQ